MHRYAVIVNPTYIRYMNKHVIIPGYLNVSVQYDIEQPNLVVFLHVFKPCNVTKLCIKATVYQIITNWTK